MLGLSSGRLVLSRGPVGLLEIRGPDPLAFLDVSQTPSPYAGLGNLRDRVRAGLWPDRLLGSGPKGALYTSSRLEGRVRRIDTEVTWQQSSASIGAPVRQAVVDPRSGSVYGVNRCGLFELIVPSTFPWDSTGDVESEVQAPEPVAPPPVEG